MDFAFAYQSTRDPILQKNILAHDCTLLEDHFSELLTPEGQSLLGCFDGVYSNREIRRPDPEFNVRVVRVVIPIIESGKAVSDAWGMTDIDWMLCSSVKNWCEEEMGGQHLMPEAEAGRLLLVIEEYLKKLKSGPGWQYKKFMMDDIPGKIIRAYPGLKNQRLKLRPVVAGAIPIRVWKPEIPALSNTKDRFFGEIMISSGDFLFVPMSSRGVIELNVRNMSVSRVLGVPMPGHQFIREFSAIRIR